MKKKGVDADIVEVNGLPLGGPESVALSGYPEFLKERFDKGHMTIMAHGLVVDGTFAFSDDCVILLPDGDTMVMKKDVADKIWK